MEKTWKVYISFGDLESAWQWMKYKIKVLYYKNEKDKSSQSFSDLERTGLLNSLILFMTYSILFSARFQNANRLLLTWKVPFFLVSAIFQSGNCYPDARSIWRINLSSNCFSFFSSSFRHIPIRHLLHRGQICLTHKSYFYLLYFLFISSFRHIPILHLLYGGNICWTP